MSRYRPVLYHTLLSPGCVRVRWAVGDLGLELDQRDVLLSASARRELVEIAGGIKIPCLVHSDTVICGTAEILKYLRLRFGQ